MSDVAFRRDALVAAAAGACSLAIELVWMRILSLTFGSASIAAGSVVAALMLGMAIGSAAAARRPGAGLDGMLLSLAAVAAASPPILRVLGLLGGFSVLAASLFMIAASIPMGTIVPLLVARSGKDGVGAAGRLYAASTLGAAAAVLVTGFVLLPALGNRATLGSAAAVLVLLGLFCRSRGPAPDAPAAAAPEPLSARTKLVLLLYGVSAFAAMMSEIGWIRSLVLSIGSSTYAYTIVLGVYIAGLGIGSALMARRTASREAGAGTFGAIQLLIALACMGSIFLLGRLPGFFGRVFYERVTSLGSFTWTALAASAAALLPPTLLVGCCFPAAVRWIGVQAGPTRASGALLAAATAGSMLGALVASFGAIPGVGVEHTLLAALALHALAGSLALCYLGPRRRVWPSLAALAIIAAVYYGPRWDVRTTQSGPYIYGREWRRKDDPRKVLFAADDSVASVAVFEHPDGNRVLRIDGKTDASLSEIDLVTQLLTAHIPLASHPKPDRIALVGLGSGMTLASCLKYDPREVHCVEISPAVVRASRLFDGQTGGPLDDRRVTLHVADARRVFRSIEGKFDVILNEPSNLWIAGMAGLFTEEFYRACEAHLADQGLMGQWLHAYGVTDETFRDAVATFQKVFPYVTVWEMWVSGDYLFVGSKTPYPIEVATMDRWLGVTKIADDLRRIGVWAPAGLLGDLVATSEDLGALPGARIQTDDGLHLEFLAPLGFYGRKRMPALSYLPPLNVATVGRAVKGAAVDWSASRELLRTGIRAVLEEKPLGMRMNLFREALKMYPADRQSRLMLEDQVDQAIKAGEWDLVPRESRRYAQARLRKIAQMKSQSAAPGALIEEYRKALSALPDHVDALAGMAEALLLAGAVEEADDYSARAVGKRPNSARTRLIRGKVYAAQKKHEDALAEWTAAVRLEPQSIYGKEAEKLIKGK
jgi:spermidine synthase